ncbi:MAG TPA: two-component sensor histidine kinase [Lachnospiraceae bacterium]|nr:two-component sensor histidine kinase [Lachnospiraceae bacterium]
MRKTLYLKFIIAYVIFAFFGFIVVSTFMQEMTMDHLEKSKAKELYKDAATIAEGYAVDLYNKEISITSLKDEIDTLSTMVDSKIWIVNPSGLVVLDSDNPVNIDDPKTIEGFDTTKMSGSYYSVGDFFGQFNSDVLTVSVPINSGFNIVGYVIFHYDIVKLQNSVNKLLNIDYIMLVIILLLSLIILIFFTEIVYLPIKKITKATEEYASGNLRYKLNVESGDEIGYLAASLSYMASELAKGEDNQKQLVANVSHDFRSPLTSIKGYLEAIKDGTIPPELYPKYIDIVLNETDRLIKLTNSLLSLNNLNTKGMVLERKDFDINKLIYSSVSTFEGKCRDKNITVDLSLTGEYMEVNADKTRIGQVLYNLIDNAIKFSHKNSSIKIETTEKNNKLFISVKDYGIGIPKDSINLVWDRFYKTDLSRGKDKKGTGLGLCITREIVRAHDENINVISTEGAGSEFIFTLPLSKAMLKEDS